MLEYPEFEKQPEDKQLLMKRHLEQVIEANKKVNLTRIYGPEEGMLLHVEDSLSALRELCQAPEGPYADLGSGAGFPGIPLAIASGRDTTLVDARQKKMTMVSQMIEELGLSEQIAVYAGRAELLARQQAGKFAVVTARALSKVNVLMELASPLLKDGGHLICYKAELSQDERDAAEKVEDLVAMKPVSERNFILGEEYKRTVLVYEKKGRPRIKLPRMEGQAQKNPLS